MRIVNMAEDQEARDFADRARAAFAADLRLHTYAHDEPLAGALFAVRWNDCTVLVVQLDPCYEPRLFDGPDMRQGEPVPVKPCDPSHGPF